MKEAKLIQHTLIPIALIFGNIAIAHFIYLIARESLNANVLFVVFGLALLSTGVFKANKFLLLLGIIAYSLFFLFSLLS